MNGFLVVIRHTMDDFPLRTFPLDQQAEAYAFAEAVDAEAGQREMDIIGTHGSTPCSVCLYEFRDGQLTVFRHIKDFEIE